MKPPNVTLDNMCIIDLEQNREDALLIRSLIQMHHNKEICLRVVAASASELKQDKKTHSPHFDEFKKRLASASLGEVKILPTLCYIGVSFVGYCLAGGGWLGSNPTQPTNQLTKLTLILNCFLQRQRMTIQVVRKKIGSGTIKVSFLFRGLAR